MEGKVKKSEFDNISHHSPNYLSKKTSSLTATPNYCALVRAMASNTREANTVDEWALLTTARQKDVETLTSLLEKGVCPNVYDVIRHEKKRERM